MHPSEDTESTALLQASGVPWCAEVQVNLLRGRGVKLPESLWSHNAWWDQLWWMMPCSIIGETNRTLLLSLVGPPLPRRTNFAHVLWSLVYKKKVEASPVFYKRCYPQSWKLVWVNRDLLPWRAMKAKDGYHILPWRKHRTLQILWATWPTKLTSQIRFPQ